MHASKDHWVGAPPPPTADGGLVLRCPVLQSLALLIGSLVLVGLGYWLVLSRREVLWGWMDVVFFGLAAVVGLASLTVTRPELRLDRDGFAFRQGLRRGLRRFSWQSVEGFADRRIRGASMSRGVFFNVASTAPRRFVLRLNRAVVGMDMMLPDNYGLSASELARLLNSWRRSSLTPESLPDAIGPNVY
jgi:hypothetical protein